MTRDNLDMSWCHGWHNSMGATDGPLFLTKEGQEMGIKYQPVDTRKIKAMVAGEQKNPVRSMT